MCPAHSSGGTLRIPRFGFVRGFSENPMAGTSTHAGLVEPGPASPRRWPEGPHHSLPAEWSNRFVWTPPSKPHALFGTFQEADPGGNAPRNGRTRTTQTTFQVLAPDRFQVTRVFYEIVSTYPTSCPRCGWCGSRKIGMREGNCVRARGLITRKS